MRPAEMPRTAPARSLNQAAHAAFVPIGIVTVLLGPLLPMLSARWSLNYSQAGSLFTAQFLGSTIGVVISGGMVARWGFRFAVNAGLFAMALGVGTLSYSSRPVGLASIFCYGIGLGFAIPAVNLFVAAVNPTRRSAALSLLNFSWSLGSVACPFIVAAVAKAGKIPVFLVTLAGVLLFVLFGIVAVRSSFVEPAPEESSLIESSALHNTGDPAALPIPWSRRSLVPLAVLFFLYVGAENSFGGWIATYAKSLAASSPTLPVMIPSFFYAAVLVGRWIAPLALKRVDETKIAQAGLLTACLGMAGLLLSRTMPPVVYSVSVAGLGLAAIYPITISRLSQEFGPAAARLGSLMFTMANLGGAFMPWTVGYASNQVHDLRVGLAIPLAATVAMYVLYWRNPAGASRLRRA